mmetsp:Transcript_38511/g.46525  ORF Transcript_38511/g.46525 Transcript_38511/m.46525 type:complete len:418 (-) Transcript_38511:251-1504(-)|eukprot:CAMPEP_0197844810 /NCGR_PEP_ID=MMETSP1438-20131217/1789_1 /TAXON_ID=1461541 /ORGANISM="Pterosperma sp., Strain CCMP1384" /LENGTH=417 /DNA_ID=CAMNT_0043455793 /DNA_START=90 /DNA_END=1343 /DNA_ORIENTATION=+
MTDETKSLGKQIRLSTESDDYDLAGYNALQCQDMVTAAFSEPIPLPKGKMIRITFVIGGGKKVRQKYGENLARDLGAALQSVGFEDDKGASCMLACQGTFKYQHDTDKDLKFMHVFPKVKEIEEEVAEEGTNGPDWGYLRSCALHDFEDIVTEMTPTFSQKRALLRVLKGIYAKFDEIDQKLIRMEALDDAEQELYNNGVEIGGKVEWLEKELDEMLTAGKLTAGEQIKMTRELDSKLVQVDEQIEKLKEKGKKTEKVEAGRETLKTKRDTIANAKPIVVQRHKSDKDIEDLRKRLQVLVKLENKKGLLTPDETTRLVAKPQLEERLKALESAGKDMGWFESEFLAAEALVPKPQKAAAPKSRPVSSSSNSGPRGGGYSARGVDLNGWTSNGTRRPPSGGMRKGPAVSNPFAMLDDE